MYWLPHEEGGTFKISKATISYGLVAMIGCMGTGLGIGAVWQGKKWLQYCDTSLVKLPGWLDSVIVHQQFGCTYPDDVQQWNHRLLILQTSVPNAVSMLDFCGKTPTILRAYDRFQGWSELWLGSGGTFEWPTEWQDILFLWLCTSSQEWWESNCW